MKLRHGVLLLLVIVLGFLLLMPTRVEPVA